MQRLAIQPCLTLLAAVLSLALASCASTERLRAWDEEAGRVASLTRLFPNSTIADVGTGDGGLALSLADRLGPRAHVYATEIDAEKLERIRRDVAERRLANVTLVEGAEDDTRLPDECCDAIVLRTVYHRLAQPTAMAASLRRALKPGGYLAVIDFPPNTERDGTAGRRETHGVSSATVVNELREAAFDFVRIVREWNNDGYYAALMRKPTSTPR